MIENACKFTGPPGQVKTKVGQEGDWITFEVIDLPGHGLGLATARAAVERHGGSLDVQSREKKGTVVTIRLPAVGRAVRE